MKDSCKTKAQLIEELTALRQRVAELEQATNERRDSPRNGEIRHHQWTDRAIHDGESNVVEHQSVGRDVSECQRVEQALRNSEERLRTVVDASKDAIVAVGEDGLITLFNDAAEQMFSYRGDEVLGQPLDRLMPEEHRAPHRRYVQSYFASGLPDEAVGKTVELTGLRSDGQRFPIELSLSIGQHGSQRFALAVIRDITARKAAEEELRRAHEELEQRVKDRTTELAEANRRLQGEVGERRRAEEALRKSEERYRALFEDAPIGVYRTTPDGRIDMVNPALVRMLGYSSFEELARRNLEEEGFEPAYPRSEFRRHIERHGTITGMEAAWKTRQGAVLHVRENAKAIRDAQGRIVYYEGTVEDITDRKAVEAALHRRIEFDALITAISTRFINLPTDAVDQGIDQALRQIGEFVGADRSYVFQYSADAARMTNTREWCAPGIAEMRHRSQELPADSLPWFSEGMERWQTVHVPSVADLPSEAGSERTEWEAQSIQSLICVPMGCGGELLGFVGFDSVKVAKSWPEEIVALLRIVGEVFANALVRRRTHEALQASEQKYRSLIENIPAAVWTTNHQGNTLFISPNIELISGYAPQEIYQSGPHLSAGGIHPDDAAYVQQAFDRLFQERKTFDVEYRFQRKDGQWIWLHDRALSTYLKQGVPCTDGVVSDITDRKRAEEALRRSEQRFRALVETTSDWVWETDRDGRYTYASPRIRDLCGYEPEEILGKTPYDLMPPNEVERVARLFKRIAKRRQPFAGLENIMLHKDGGQVSLERSGVPILDERGQLLGYRGIDRDITRRKQAQEALRRSDRLAAMGTTVAGVAHELNNPLTSICGLSQFLARDDSLGPEARNLALEIAGQAQRCSKIVESLLGFAREKPVTRRSVSINTLLDNCLRLTRHDPRFEDIEIETDFDPALPSITADPYQLEQVFINIITNARDALAEAPAEKRLTVRTTRERGEVGVEFSDTGPGITDPSKVFDPFYTTKRTGAGTGLGLSVSYGIVEEHGGSITAHNLEKGACFTVRLPIGPPLSPELEDNRPPDDESGH